jgi:hypothetical protein
MNFNLPSRLGLVVVCLCAAAAAARAEDAGKSEPAAKPPAAAKADAVADCIGTDGEYQTKGQRISYVITLSNKCEKRLQCEVFAYVVGARGPSSGHAVLKLGAKSSGAAAKKSYAMNVKAAGGTAQISRDCKTF